MSLLFGGLARAQAPAAAPDEPWLRGGLSFAMVPHSYQFTSTAPDTPDSVEYSNGAFTGGLAVLVTGHLPHDPTWGAELRWKGFTDLIDIDEDTYNRFGTDFYLGARYRTDPRNGLSGVGSLGIHRYLSAFFRYESAAMVAGDPELLNVPVTGLRLGVAGQYVNDKVLAEVGIGQTLAPQPVGFNFHGLRRIPARRCTRRTRLARSGRAFDRVRPHGWRGDRARRRSVDPPGRHVLAHRAALTGRIGQRAAERTSCPIPSGSES